MFGPAALLGPGVGVSVAGWLLPVVLLLLLLLLLLLGQPVLLSLLPLAHLVLTEGKQGILLNSWRQAVARRQNTCAAAQVCTLGRLQSYIDSGKRHLSSA